QRAADRARPLADADLVAVSQVGDAARGQRLAYLELQDGQVGAVVDAYQVRRVLALVEELDAELVAAVHHVVVREDVNGVPRLADNDAGAGRDAARAVIRIGAGQAAEEVLERLRHVLVSPVLHRPRGAPVRLVGAGGDGDDCGFDGIRNTDKRVLERRQRRPGLVG